MMDLEKRERELKSLLDMAESLEERKKLRSELREIRQKMFEAPAADSKSTVQFKNAKNEMLTVVVGESGDRNNNLVTLKPSDDPPRAGTEQQDSQKMADLEAERQEALRAKPAEERAARRARRAQHMNLLKKDKEESVDLPDSPKLARHTSSSSRLDSSSDEPGRGQPEIESTGAKKFGEVTITTSSADEEGVRKKETEDEEKGDSFPEKGKSVMTNKPPLKTPLGRSATWSGKEPLNASAQSKPASVTLGPARNKFDSQVGKPLEFGTSYVSKNKEPGQHVANGRVGSQTDVAMQNRSFNKYVPSQALPSSNRYGSSDVTRNANQPIYLSSNPPSVSAAGTVTTHSTAADAPKAAARIYAAEEATLHHTSASSTSVSVVSNKSAHVMSTESKAAIASIRRVASMRVQPSWKSAAPAVTQSTVSTGPGITEQPKPAVVQLGQHRMTSTSNSDQTSSTKVALQPLVIKQHEGVGNAADRGSRVDNGISSSSSRLSYVRPKNLTQTGPDFPLNTKSDEEVRATHPKVAAVASAPNVASMPMLIDRQSVTQPISRVREQNYVQAAPIQPDPVGKPPLAGSSLVVSRNGSDQTNLNGEAPSASTKRLTLTTKPEITKRESPSQEEILKRFSAGASTLVPASKEDSRNPNSNNSTMPSAGDNLVTGAPLTDSTPALGTKISLAPHRTAVEERADNPLKISEAGSSALPVGTSPSGESRSTELVSPVSSPPTISFSAEFEDAMEQSTARATPSEPASPSKSLEPPQTDSVLYKRADPTPKRHHPSAPGLGAPAAGTVKKNASVSSRANIFQKAAEEEQAKIDKEKNQLAVRQNISKASSTSNLPEATKETEKKEDDKKTTAPCLKKREKKRPVRRTMSISSIVLDWVQEMVSDYEDYGVEVKNFSSSWNDGMAFCALIHKFNPDSFDFSLLRKENKRYNFELAFKTGLERKNIPILLDVEDMIRMEKPEPRSVQCYVQWIWSVYGPTSGYGPSMEEIKQAQVA